MTIIKRGNWIGAANDSDHDCISSACRAFYARARYLLMALVLLCPSSDHQEAVGADYMQLLALLRFSSGSGSRLDCSPRMMLGAPWIRLVIILGA